jgi:hypothetical protein
MYIGQYIKYTYPVLEPIWHVRKFFNLGDVVVGFWLPAVDAVHLSGNDHHGQKILYEK